MDVASRQEGIPTLADLSMAYGERAISWITGQLLVVNSFIGAKEKMSDNQLCQLAMQIRYDYGYLNLMEFILFCARLRSNRYGEFYGSVDPSKVLKGIRQFVLERGRDLYARRQKEERMQLERERLEYARMAEEEKPPAALEELKKEHPELHGNSIGELVLEMMEKTQAEKEQTMREQALKDQLRQERPSI